MKLKENKEIIALIIIIPIILWIAFNISSRMDGQLPNYSVENKSSYGSSVFYETLKELNYNIGKSLKSVDSEDKNTVQIVMDGGDFNVNDASVKNWVKNGGTLIYLVPSNVGIVTYGIIPEINEEIRTYKYYKGTVITANAKDISNGSLAKKTDKAYKVLMEIDKYSDKKIYFNEKNLYSNDDSTVLWDYMPSYVKFIIYQIIIVVVVFIYYKGKRFGKIVPYVSEEERMENEYLYSAAALYKQAECFDLMLENYYKNFLNEMKFNDDKWIDYWKKEELPQYKKALKAFKFIQDKKKKIQPKEYIEIINIFNELSDIVKKRRESYWKTLKKTI